MATRSRIAIANPDGSYTSVYCHWDGYPDNNGRILAEHYSSTDKVRLLLSGGDFSSLEPNPEEIGYYSQRGETGVEALVSATLADLVFLTQDCGGEWLYVWDGAQWLVAEGGVAMFGLPASRAPGELHPLSEFGVET